jgi:hypothetical protein
MIADKTPKVMYQSNLTNVLSGSAKRKKTKKKINADITW